MTWRSVFCGFLLPLLTANILCAQDNAAPPDSARPGARLAFPNHGTLNAFVIFVQFPDEPDGTGEWGNDPTTEWPHERSLSPTRTIPAWAEDGKFFAPPGTSPASFDEGSISAFYQTMSHGRFTLTGHIYPHVYHPARPIGWYHENRGSFPNGAVALSHEMLTSEEMQMYFDLNPDGLDLSAFDRYRNGTNVLEPDGNFDLIVVIHRDPVLPRLRLNRHGRPASGSSISSLGADTELRPDHGPIDYTDPASDAFGPAPVTLGGLHVIDNVTSGSGITGQAITRKQAVRIVAHELGHRHFGFFHTCDSPIAPTSDCLSILAGSYITMTAPDRIKLGWAEVVPIDVPSFGKLDVTILDALASGQVFRVREGADACGDLIIEARFWTNFWDSPPNPDDPAAPFVGNDDADEFDLFLPQEGLYLYKAPEPGTILCGGALDSLSPRLFYSSLENNGIQGRMTPFREDSDAIKAFRVGGTYQVAYEPGHTFAPFQRPRFFAHANTSLDRRLTLTNIRRAEGAFEAEIWTDYLVDPQPAPLLLQPYPNPFVERTTIRYELPDPVPVRIVVYDALGRQVALLANGPHQAGIHEVPFDAQRMSAGLYWCRIDAGPARQTLALHVVR